MKPTQADIDRAAFLKRQKEKALIAAAPDLLKALHLLLDKLHAHAPGLVTNVHMESAFIKAEMAIAKAEGVK